MTTTRVDPVVAAREARAVAEAGDPVEMTTTTVVAVRAAREVAQVVPMAMITTQVEMEEARAAREVVVEDQAVPTLMTITQQVMITILLLLMTITQVEVMTITQVEEAKAARELLVADQVAPILMTTTHQDLPKELHMPMTTTLLGPLVAARVAVKAQVVDETVEAMTTTSPIQAEQVQKDKAVGWPPRAEAAEIIPKQSTTATTEDDAN